MQEIRLISSDQHCRLRRFHPVRTGRFLSLTDETYSLLCSLKVPEEIDEKKVMFLISLLDQIYWIVGSVAGAALGQVLPFDMTGIDFAMTALFDEASVISISTLDKSARSPSGLFITNFIISLPVMTPTY